MKKNNELLLTQKAQAVISLILGLMIIIMAAIGAIGKMRSSEALRNISGIVFPFALGAYTFVFGVALNGKKQRGDELSKELMLKAGSMSVFFEALAVFVIAIIVGAIGYARGNYTFTVDSADILMFGTLLCGVNLAARSLIFLWLDRTPEADEDE